VTRVFRLNISVAFVGQIAIALSNLSAGILRETSGGIAVFLDPYKFNDVEGGEVARDLSLLATSSSPKDNYERFNWRSFAEGVTENLKLLSR